MTDKIKVPPQWEWGIGTSSDKYYDYWAYHVDDEYELHMFWDKGGEHCVEIIPINGRDENGDPNYGYPQKPDSFETEEEALEYAKELMEEHK